MPELPEVETIKLGLEKKIVGLTIANIEVRRLKTFQGNSKNLWGKKVLKVWRRAKILGVDLNGNLTLLFHLKMTGQLIYVGERGEGERLIGGHPTLDMRDQMPNKSTVVIFEFNDPLHREASKLKLFFNDQRRFGWVKVVDSQQLAGDSEKILGSLGPEPLEKGFTWEVLKLNLLKHKSQPIKVSLMDQSVVSGIGNIYASECLFLARIDPRKKVSSLSDEEFQRLHQGIIESLKTGIKHGGSTRAHFVNIDGEKGYFLDYANVYGKDRQQCKGCSGKIKKITQGGRGTYWCPNCQR